MGLPKAIIDIMLEQRYRIQRTCVLCKHGKFVGADLGTCQALGVPIHKSGRCTADFSLDKDKLSALNELAGFIRE